MNPEQIKEQLLKHISLMEFCTKLNAPSLLIREIEYVTELAKQLHQLKHAEPV
jgi:hypothetical protein